MVVKHAAQYIGIDSIDGAGKDFQTEWLHQAFYAANILCLVVNEPKSTRDGQTLYDMVTTGETNRWDCFSEACLWSAARSKANHEFIQPALARNEWVITHRTPLTTIAYQGYAREGNINLIRDMQYEAAPKWPDYFILLDLDPEIGIARKKIQKTEAGLDRFEKRGASFQEKVRFGLLEEVKKLKIPYVIINASQSKRDVHLAILNAINEQYQLNLKPLI